MNIKFDYSKDEDALVVKMHDYPLYAKKISAPSVEKMIQDGVSIMVKTRQDYWYSSTGDTLVLITWEDEVTLYVHVCTHRQYGTVTVPEGDL